MLVKMILMQKKKAHLRELILHGKMDVAVTDQQLASLMDPTNTIAIESQHEALK